MKLIIRINKIFNRLNKNKKSINLKINYKINLFKILNKIMPYSKINLMSYKILYNKIFKIQINNFLFKNV